MPENPIRYHEGGFPPNNIEWERLIPLIGPANAALARFDGILSAIPNTTVLLSPLITQEAVLSSRIEGTQATMGDVLEFEAGISNESAKTDIFEVLNYRRAMWHAVDLLKELPLCQRILKDAHKVLMENVRGENRNPGQYRKIQNWIGPPGTPIEKAKYIPISCEKLPETMSHWERYIHEDTPDSLVQLAVLHAEFESLHPFLDGNGRLGRMFVPLFLYTKKLIQSPMFYISEYLDKYRGEYYECLLSVSREGDWTGWCVFFLKAISEQAKENHRKAEAILNLYKLKKDEFTSLPGSKYSIKALDFLFEKPIFNSSGFTQQTGIPGATAKRILAALQTKGILKVIKKQSGRSPSVMAFRELLNIAEGSEVF